MALKNELTLASIKNQDERAKKELEIQLAQQIEEIKQRQITEEQKSALILAVTEANAGKVAEIEKNQAQAVEDFKFALKEDSYAKQKEQVDRETADKITQLDQLKLSEEDYAAAVVEINRQAAEAKDEIGKAQLNAQLSATASTLGNAAELFGENTIAYKALKIAETTISTYQSAVSAYASTVGIPVVGPILAPIAAATAVASGLASIAKIAGVQINKKGGGAGGAGGGGGEQKVTPSKFATGGLVVGPGGPMTDNIPAMLSPGESVINARSTEMFGGILSTINTLGGGSSIPAGNGGTPVIKTYVVASEMTNQQEADKRIADIARI